MEDQCSPLNWDYFFYQEEGFEDIRHSLVYTTLELEATIVSAKEEITRRECEIIHLNDLLSRAIKERDEAQEKCQKLMLEKLELQQELQQQQKQQVLQNQQLHQKDSISQNEDELQGCISKILSEPAASSDCGESNIASPDPGSAAEPPALQTILELAEKKPLPENGKFLKALIEAGPLLQTLLLAGPLPQWQHPPPQLHSIEIPPVTISSPTFCPLSQDSSTIPCLINKRDLFLCAGTDFPTDSKHRKLTVN
ncbi:hypothetical protein L6164_007367 [Bauhinia variegata]|uniref:Uncharacterized protein n=1 Tax=Bauhinia variegata TaxID=167791 RepID=A0ACB9PES5_BAUVA|nr:hypothetical protein L6164_007367 [Bauhinia variegata]